MRTFSWRLLAKSRFRQERPSGRGSTAEQVLQDRVSDNAVGRQCQSAVLKGYNPFMPDEGTLLYRPAGQKELDLIALTDFTAFPPRLEGQPIFYPVLNEEYASFIAREWNTVDEASGYIGYVLRFAVDSAYLNRFSVQKVGSASALEYWIPAEQLDEFNRNIIGRIELISTFRPVGS